MQSPESGVLDAEGAEVVEGAVRAPAYSRWAVSLATAAAVVPAVVLAFMVRRYGVDLPYFDEWGLTGLIRRSLKGTLRFHDFYAQHAVHRLVFPRLILLAMARATGWDTRYELAINFALGCGVACLLALRAGSASVEFRSRLCLWLVPVYSLMALSLSQFENWMWGWQNQIFLVVLASSSAFFVLTRPRLGYKQMSLAIVLAVVATFSFANGLLTWPLGLVALMFPGLRDVPTRRVFIAIWIVATIVVFAAYFHDLSMPGRYREAEKGWNAPINFAEYFLAYLGGPFAMFRLRLGIAAGACGLAISAVVAAYLVLVRPVRPGAYLPGALLWLFGLGSALLTVFGRADFGAVQGLSSRYITISNLFWIGTMMMFAAACYAPTAEGKRRGRRARWARAAFASFMLVSIAAMVRAEVFGMESVRQFSFLERTLRYKLLQGARDEQMLMLSPDLKWLEAWKNMAQRNHLWAWRPNAPASMFDPPPASFDEL